MLNTNICKLLTVKVLPVTEDSCVQKAEYKGQILEIMDMKPIEAGNRRLYLKYSICNDQYYLTKRG